MTTYERYVRQMTIAADLQAASSLLSWDQELHIPPGAINRRAGQLATLAELRHEMLLREALPLVEQLRKTPGLTYVQRLNLTQNARDLDKARRLPGEFVAALAQKTAETQFAWEQARKELSYKRFAEPFAELLTLKRREANYLGYEDTPYNALLDSYEPGATCARLDVIFGPLRTGLLELLAVVQAAPQVDDSFLKQHIPKEDQLKFTLKVLGDMGFDFAHGRQDISTHPFTTSFGMEDVRVTTRVDENDLTNALYSSIHEGGHALYEQGLDPAHFGLPAAEACSLSIHESQSRIWENNIGRSLAFIEFYFDDLKALFPDKLKGRTPEDVFRALNKIEPSLIRTQADELTYHFHVMLRYELERKMIEGELSVADLPAAWDEAVERNLGIRPTGLLDGVLQDVHWSIGALGYFPTYSLGSMYAAQFQHFIQAAVPDFSSHVRTGQFGALRDWLRDQVWLQGRLYDSDDLCRRITGEPLQSAYFLSYIKTKAAQVYGLTI